MNMHGICTVPRGTPKRHHDFGFNNALHCIAVFTLNYSRVHRQLQYITAFEENVTKNPETHSMSSHMNDDAMSQTIANCTRHLAISHTYTQTDTFHITQSKWNIAGNNFAPTFSRLVPTYLINKAPVRLHAQKP